MVVSPFIVYVNQTALDVRKSVMWAPKGTDVSVYTRCTPGIPNDTPKAAFEAAKQADVDAAAFVT